MLLVVDDERESDGRRADESERASSDDADAVNDPGDAPDGPLIDDLRRLGVRIARLDDANDAPELEPSAVDAVLALPRIEFIMRASMMCDAMAASDC